MPVIDGGIPIDGSVMPSLLLTLTWTGIRPNDFVFELYTESSFDSEYQIGRKCVLESILHQHNVGLVRGRLQQDHQYEAY